MIDQSPWFVHIGNKTLGPFTARQLKQLADSSWINPDTHVRRGTDGQWVMSRKVKGLFSTAKPTVEPEPPPVVETPTTPSRKSRAFTDDEVLATIGDRLITVESLNPNSEAQPPNPPKQTEPEQGASDSIQPHRGEVVLALGVASFVAPVVGLVAWAMGRKDLKAMDLGKMDPSGHKFTQLGYVFGVCNSILLILIVAFVVVSWFVIIFSLSSGLRFISREIDQPFRQADHEMDKTDLQMAADSVEQARVALEAGDYMDAHAKAGMAAEAFLEAGDEENYRVWKKYEKRLAERLGQPRY